jgi:hypothetical protein
MFKIFRKKIQSLSQTQQNIITVILILFNLAIIVFWINFWVGLKKVPPKIVEKPKQIEEISEKLKPGEIGEPKEGERPQIKLPPVISSTGGEIKEIQKDKLIILGDGSNFSDQKSRELTLIFVDTTITSELDRKIQYQGLEGLKHLKIGDKIIVSSTENIRGKTEFSVDYVNKL